MAQDNLVEINPTELEAAKDTLGFNNNGKYRPKPQTPWTEIEKSLHVLDRVSPDKIDLTTQDGIALYMLQSIDEPDWKRRTDDAQKANGNAYPSFWFGLITGGVVQ